MKTEFMILNGRQIFTGLKNFFHYCIFSEKLSHADKFRHDVLIKKFNSYTDDSWQAWKMFFYPK